MTKAEVVSSISKQTGYYARDIEKIINKFIETITQSLAHEERVTIGGLMSLYPISVPEKQNRNPLTGELKTREAHIRVKPVISKKMLSIINGSDLEGEDESES